MFFYTFLLIASVFVAIVIVWLGRAINSAGAKAYRIFLPSHKTNYQQHLTAHVKDRPLSTTINKVPMPWGWQGEARPSQLAPANAPAAAGSWGAWPNKINQIREHLPDHGPRKAPKLAKQVVESRQERLLRQKQLQADLGNGASRLEIAEKRRAVAPRAQLRKTNLRTSSKPWGW